VESTQLDAAFAPDQAASPPEMYFPNVANWRLGDANVYSVSLDGSKIGEVSTKIESTEGDGLWYWEKYNTPIDMNTYEFLFLRNGKFVRGKTNGENTTVRPDDKQLLSWKSNVQIEVPVGSFTTLYEEINGTVFGRYENWSAPGVVGADATVKESIYGLIKGSVIELDLVSYTRGAE